MRYQMRQKMLAWGDDFVIRDDAGHELYYVDGKAFSIGQKLSFQDREGRELAFIRQRLLAWGQTYEIERDGAVVAVVKKALFTFLHCSFTVDVPGPDDLEARGDLLDHEYAFSRQGRDVAWVSKKWFRLTDSYGIETAPGEDDVLLLASAIVVDLACHADEQRT